MNDRELTDTEINLAYQLEKRFCGWDTAKKCAAFAVQYLGKQERKPSEWIIAVDESGKVVKVREVIE